MELYSLPKKMRLSGRSAVSRLFAEGQSGFVYPFRYMFTAEAEEMDKEKAGVAILITVSKKYHKRANRRNTLKRRTREAFRILNKELITAAEKKNMHINIALIYSTKDILEFKTISDAVEKILRQVGQRM